VVVGIGAFVFVWVFNRLLLRVASGIAEDRKRIMRNLQRFVQLIVFAFALVLVLSIFEIDVTGLLAGLGVGALVIGFALKDIIENWVSGLLIISGKTFRVGDVILVGNLKGVVTDISLRTTKLRTYDRNEVVIPNSLLLNEKIVNLTYGKKDTVVSIIFSIDYIFNLEKAKKAIESGLRRHPNVLADTSRKREIRFVVRNKEWTTEIEALFWIDSPENEEFIKSQITEYVKQELEKEKILPPLPSIIRKDFLQSKE
jgi:small-conductance mechanosensitive channel